MATNPSNIIIDELQFEWDSILEVGSSWGYVLGEVQKYFPDRIVKGIDKENIGHGNDYTGVIERGKENGLDISYGDGTDMEFEDNSFDVVYCQALLVMNTFENFHKIIREMIRVAKKKVIFIEPHCENISKEKIFNLAERLITNYKDLAVILRTERPINDVYFLSRN